METTFNPAAIEKSRYNEWEKSGYFKPSGNGEAFSIMIPPPNVTGSLHMGHGFQEAIMDALVRYQRMRDKNTLWQVGTDHAGIATQMVVERQLNQKGQTKNDLGRDAFIEKVWEWKEESGGTITQQLRRMGASPDWSRERFTMDDGFSSAVQEVFIRLYNDGLIYRGNRLVNWDPKLHTAISDLEVISEEEQGHMWHFKYPLSDGSGHMVVATTRPETMLGDSAVAVNPSDDRYQHLIGQTISLPLTNREIPIIADEYVDQDFGTGCVKITPAHDFNDYEMGQRHDLEMINIFDQNACLNDSVPECYQGIDRFVARKQIVADLDDLGLLDKIDKHTLQIPRGDRSGVVIEPWLTNQWYVAAKPLAEKAIAAVEDGDIKFVPQQYENMYFSWMRDIQDWCISRQLWWGHRIPAWYDTNGNIYVGDNEASVREKHNIADDVQLQQDDDVLDTWFSSALWTFGTLGWPNETPELKTFHPSNVLVTGFDIIFFWVARMIMMTLYFRNEVPFHTVYVHGLVRDSQGAKMSKSKGNVLDPIDLIDGIDLETLVGKRTAGLMKPKDAEKIERATRQEFPDGIASYGTDALRYTYYSLASTGRDIKFDVGRIQGFRNFCNKIWNASRYVLMNTESFDCGTDGHYELSLADRWIISRLQRVEKSVSDAIDIYRFDLASQALYDFIWNEYCDWYLELSKPILWDEDINEAIKTGTRHTLISVLEAILRLAHPMMPFITEEIWQRVAPLCAIDDDTIMLQPFPLASPDKINDAAESEVSWLQAIIIAIRNIRGEMNISPGKTLPLLLRNTTEIDQQRLKECGQLLSSLAKLDSITILNPGEAGPLCATGLAGNIEVLIPMSDLIDKQAEISRLAKEIDKLDLDAKRILGKLNNASFVEKAPAPVVEKERERLENVQNSLVKLTTQKATIEAM